MNFRGPATQKRMKRVCIVSDIVVGLTLILNSVSALSGRFALLAVLAIVCGIALVVTAVIEIRSQHEVEGPIAWLEVVAGLETCLTAAEKFHEHKHWLPWVYLLSGTLLLAVAFFRTKIKTAFQTKKAVVKN